jgi:hypothetical protein
VHLKTIPMLNGDGQPLQVCNCCFGSGVRNRATRPAGGDVQAIDIQPKSVRTFEKDGWRVERMKCEPCKGAGTVRSEQPGNW